jgi:hypothetical protein
VVEHLVHLKTEIIGVLIPRAGSRVGPLRATFAADAGRVEPAERDAEVHLRY